MLVGGGVERGEKTGHWDVMLHFLCRNMLLHINACNLRSFSCSRSLSSVPTLTRRVAHVWYLVPEEVKDASLLKQYMDILSPCEKENVLLMKGQSVQKTALLTRALVRTTLSRYTSFRIHPRSFVFRKNEFGKPEVAYQDDDPSMVSSLQFNVSHTPSMIVCGVTLDVPIGIDIEEKRRKTTNSIHALARRYFSPAEIEYLNGFNDFESQRKEFIKIWTIKEAYVKALGRGFSGAPFKDFTIRFGAVKESLVSGNSEAWQISVEPSPHSENLTSSWQFEVFELCGSHYAAICVGKDENMTEQRPLELKVWKTIPLVEDECTSDASGTSLFLYST